MKTLRFICSLPVLLCLTGGLILRAEDGRASNPPSDPQRGSITVSGRVTDPEGEPVVGAAVFVAGTRAATVTDSDGRYSLNLPRPDSEVTISSLGFLDSVFRPDGRTEINVRLNLDTSQLDEVVVVGYGTQKKINLTGSVAMIKGGEMASRPVASVSSGLQGLLPGVDITASTGQPGAAPGIRIRGVNTINSSTAPLILIDGVAGGDLNLLNPLDIESVSVLKDASSSAIYGARAANGVILITTRKGRRSERVTLSYQGYLGMQTPTALPRLVNGREFMELSNEAQAAAGFAKPYTDEAFRKYDAGDSPNDYSNTDWVGQIFKKQALQTGHSVSLQGGSAKSGWFMSYGNLKQTGLVVGDSYGTRRHNARMSLDTEVLNALTLRGTLSFVDYNLTTPGLTGTGGVFRLAQRISPLVPVMWQEKGADGLWHDTPWWGRGSVSNPVYVAKEGGKEYRKSRTLNGIFEAVLRLPFGFRAEGQYSANYYWRETDCFSPTMPVFNAVGDPDPGNVNMLNSVSQSHQDALTQSVQATLHFDRTFGRHEISALGGFSTEWYGVSSLSGARKNIILEGIEVLNAGTQDITNAGTRSAWALESFFGRINYAFAGKYLLEANLRIDGTSRFAPENRWGLFPSFSAGWNFMRERFLAALKPAVSSGKIRASWGELGNQNLGGDFYPYISPIERMVKAYPIGTLNNVGFLHTRLGNRNIKWETIRMLDVGADLGFFDNRLQLTFDWFRKENIDAMVKPVFPTIVGIDKASLLPFENMGRIENKGWELDLSWRDRIGQVAYGLRFNLSDARNKIVDLGESEPSLGNSLRREGDPINAFYGLLTDGLAQIDDFGGRNEDGKYIDPKFVVPTATAAIVQPGDIKYRDIGGPDGKPDGLIDENDKAVFGDPYPHYSYALRGDLAWKGLDFSFFLQGVGQVDGYLSEEARHCFINDYSVPKVEHLDRWTPNNPDATYPRLYQAQTHNLVFSDYWLEDASYLRVKNVQLGYTLPQKIVKAFGASGLRIYLSVDNLLTFTNYFSSFDPEVRQTSGAVYPQVKTWVCGLSLKF